MTTAVYAPLESFRVRKAVLKKCANQTAGQRKYQTGTKW